MTPVTVILPTYNEAGHIVSLIRDITTSFHPKEILIVDDNSPDGTADIIGAAHLAHVRVIKNHHREGLTASIQKGIDNASTTYIAWMDADFSHPPEVLSQLYTAVQHADIAVASLFLPDSHDNRSDRRATWFSWSINTLCRYLLDSRITNYTSGYIMTTKDVCSTYRLHGDYGEYCIEFLYRNLKYGYKIVEIPYISQSRKSGESKTATTISGYITRGWKYLLTVMSCIIHQ
jgi:dolichol-phosphate mannosyltransferase